MTTSHRGKRASLVTITLVLLASALPVLAASAAPALQKPRQVALYRGEQFGWHLFYDASQWQILVQDAGPGYEFVRFSDGQVLAVFWAFDAPGLTGDACLSAVLSTLAAEPATVVLEDLFTGQGDPVITPYESSAWAEFILSEDHGDGISKFAVLGSCEELDPGQTRLYQASIVPAAAHNAGVGYLTPWLAGYLPIHRTDPHDTPIAVPDREGRGAGALDAESSCALGEPFYVEAENTDDSGAFAIDAAVFTAVYDTGEVVPALFRGWLYPRPSATNDVELPPGDLGLFELEVPAAADADIATRFELYYGTDPATRIDLGWAGGCGGGGGAPVLIDLE